MPVHFGHLFLHTSSAKAGIDMGAFARETMYWGFVGLIDHVDQGFMKGYGIVVM